MSDSAGKLVRVPAVEVYRHCYEECRHCGHRSEGWGGCNCAIGKPYCVACGCPRALPLNAPPASASRGAAP